MTKLVYGDLFFYKKKAAKCQKDTIRPYFSFKKGENLPPDSPFSFNGKKQALKQINKFNGSNFYRLNYTK